MDCDDSVSFIVAVLGGFILMYGLYSLVIKEKLYISEAVVAAMFGIIIRLVATETTERFWEHQNDLSRQSSRIVIAVQVMAAGVALPKKYLWKEWKSLTVLLVPVMSWMWIISALFVWWMIPNLKFLEALMIASCFTPTDPVLANSIVQGYFAEKYVPANIRYILSAESAANDGLGFPFLFLATYLIQLSPADALFEWTYHIMIYEIGFSIICGIAIGYLARKVLRFSMEKKLVDDESFAVYPVVLALFLMGTVGLIRSDDLLACFFAGCAFAWDGWYHVETKNSASFPWSSWAQLGWTRLLILALLVHLFRRLPIVLMLYRFIPAIRSVSEAVFAGWFGPMGVGSVFYCALALDTIRDEGSVSSYAREAIEPVVYFIVLSSIVVHGVSIPLYQAGKKCVSRSQQQQIRADLEHTPVSLVYSILKIMKGL
ncbi:Cation/H+ exchanger [Fennellomyces sp. T-0311]|nr:Cation/H+ exchanger [Fennellomyces sp. T-0311]